MSPPAPTPEGNAATLAIVALAEQAGLSGSDLVRAYRIVESYVFGATIFDFEAAPDHLAIRARRYMDSGHPDVQAVAGGEEAIGVHNDEAFCHGPDVLLTALGV